jgi:dehydrogenase/reductase SDR family member 12
VALVTERIVVDRAPQAVFDYVADFSNAAEWDPTIDASRRLDAGPIGLGSRFEVTIRMGPVPLRLVYEIVTYEPSARVVLATTSRVLRGRDDVRIERDGDRTTILWDAQFGLAGPGRLLDPLIRPGFAKVAGDAAEGLRRTLDRQPSGR